MQLLLMQPFHPSFLKLESVDRHHILASCIRNCIKVTQTEQRFHDTMCLILNSPDHAKQRAKLMKATKPGGYIQAAMPDWIRFYNGKMLFFKEQLSLLQERQEIEVPKAVIYRLDDFEQWLAAQPEFVTTPCVREVIGDIATLQMLKDGDLMAGNDDGMRIQ